MNNKKNLRRDIFVLILGYGRTGTSLCVGLLNSTPRFNIGYEINNSDIYRDSSKKKLELLEKNLKFSINSVFPEEYNGNKIVFSGRSDFDKFKFYYFQKVSIVGSEFLGVRVIFTERNPIDTLVSRNKRLLNKGIKTSISGLVCDYLSGMKIIKQVKEFFPNHYIFDFDKVIDTPSLSKGLFNFVGERYRERYITNYRGTGNYDHAIGVGKENVLFGRDDKFLKLRHDIKQEFVRRIGSWQKERILLRL